MSEDNRNIFLNYKGEIVINLEFSISIQLISYPKVDNKKTLHKYMDKQNTTKSFDSYGKSQEEILKDILQ